MQGNNLQVADWEMLAALVILGSYTAMSKSRADVLPSVHESLPNPVEQKPREKKGRLSPEVQEFMQLPPHIQRQVLDYARNWISASYERTD